MDDWRRVIKVKPKYYQTGVELLSNILVYYLPNEFSGFNKELVRKTLKVLIQG